MSDLPQNWEYGKLSQAAHVVRGITFPAGEKRNDLAQGYVCCLRTTNVQQTLEWDDVYYVPTSYVKRAEQLVREGDVLMSMANSYELVGKVARAINVPQPAAFGAFLAAVRPTHAIDGGYLYHFLRSSEVQSRLREGSSQTTNIANISVGRLAELPVPLAPWNEQKRIAEKLDTVLTRVDAVNTRLARVAPILKRFRQSVLAAATSGRLTEDWRSARNHVLTTVPFSHLLSKHPGALKRGPFGSAIKKSFFVPKGFKVYEQKNAIQNDETLGDYFIDANKYSELEDFAVAPSDFIVSCAGTIGRIARLSESAPPGVINQALMRIRLDADVVRPEYFLHLFEAPWFQESILEKTQGTAMKNMAAVKVIKQVPVVLPGMQEQAEIVRRIETLFAFADRLEARLQTAQTAADRLTPALLAKAFRGELVPQDPNDEPASELLKRLAEQRPASKPTRLVRKVKST